jgi:predicted patatin/cPLA2 family phospholipase
MSTTWKQRTRYSVSADNSWKPCICIQGGGARGAWEAGVVASLLGSPATAAPVAIWGTSAGALNAMWASSLPENADPTTLLNYWRGFAFRIRLALLGLFLVLIGLLVTAVSCLGAILISVILFAVVAILLVLLRTRTISRLPGLFPVPMAALLVPQPAGVARFYTYFCTADVSRPNPPETWSFETLGVFCTAPGAVGAQFLHDDIVHGARVAAMSSAALPLVCRPYPVGKGVYLDGGLEANLPAGFIEKHGTLGGHCAICIIPRPLSLLNPNEHVDYRVLRFLHDLQTSQAHHRKSVAEATSWTGPAHTLFPILVIAPQCEPSAGLIRGFFLPSRLERDFHDGQAAAERVTNAMDQFLKGKNDALEPFLLDTCELTIGDKAPRAGWWSLWANANWR